MHTICIPSKDCWYTYVVIHEVSSCFDLEVQGVALAEVMNGQLNAKPSLVKNTTEQGNTVAININNCLKSEPTCQVVTAYGNKAVWKLGNRQVSNIRRTLVGN